MIIIFYIIIIIINIKIHALVSKILLNFKPKKIKKVKVGFLEVSSLFF